MCRSCVKLSIVGLFSGGLSLKHLLVIALASSALAACGTTSGPPTFANSAFDYASSNRNADAERFGYELSGRSGWSASMAYEDTRGQPTLNFVYTARGGASQSGLLSISMPYLENGVRRFSGETDDGDYISVELQAGPCREGGTSYNYFSNVQIGDDNIQGCASEVAAVDRWSNYLTGYLPAIDVCLAEFGGRAQHVSVAYPLASGSTGVRVVDGEGRTWECVTRENDEAVNSMRPLDAADAMFGEGDPVFVRSRMPQMGEGCYVYESVRESNGHLIGSFGFDTCNAGPYHAIG